MFYLIQTTRISLPVVRSSDNEIQLLHSEITAEDGSLENNVSSQRKEILLLIDEIRKISISKDFSSELFETAKKQLRSVKAIFAAASLEVPYSNNTIVREPSNKNIVPQCYPYYRTTGTRQAIPQLQGLRGSGDRKLQDDFFFLGCLICFRINFLRKF